MNPQLNQKMEEFKVYYKKNKMKKSRMPQILVNLKMKFQN